MGFPAHERLLAEVGHKRLHEIHDAIKMLLPCPTCGASICKPCMTVEGKSPGSPTVMHIARVKQGRVLYQMWHRMASEALDRIDEREAECLKKLGVG